MSKAAAVVPIRPAEPADEFAELRERRAFLREEHLRFGKVHRTYLDAQTALAALDEQASIDAAERAAWNGWVGAAESEPPPQPLSERRADLERRRILAARDLAAARNGAAAVEPRLAEINTELVLINDQIFAAKIERALERILDLHQDFIENAAATRAMMMKLNSFHIFLLELAASPFRARFGIDVAIQDALVTFDALKQAPLGPDLEALARYTAEFRRELQ